MKRRTKTTKRKLTFSIVLVLGLVLLSVLGSDSTSQAQKPDRHVADTGVVTLGPNQILRVTVVNRSKADLNVRFGRMEYSQGTCNGGVCNLQTNINNEAASRAVTLAPTEAASMDIPNSSFGVRGVVFLTTNLNNEVGVVAQIIDSQTGMFSTGWDVLIL